MKERQFTYEEGYEDGVGSGKDECIDILNEMDLEKYDYHTIQAAIQMIKGETVTHEKKMGEIL